VHADYAFRISGRVSPALTAALEPLNRVETLADTFLVGPVTDRAALHGYIAHLDVLGLELVELRRLPTGDDGGPHRCPCCGRAGPGGPLAAGRWLRRSGAVAGRHGAGGSATRALTSAGWARAISPVPGRRGGSQVGVGSERGGQFAARDSPTGDPVWDQPHPVSVRAGCPRLHAPLALVRSIGSSRCSLVTSSARPRTSTLQPVRFR
jgi:hypothetical protein